MENLERKLRIAQIVGLLMGPIVGLALFQAVTFNPVVYQPLSQAKSQIPNLDRESVEREWKLIYVNTKTGKEGHSELTKKYYWPSRQIAYWMLDIK